MKTLKNKFILGLVFALAIALCASIMLFNPVSANAAIKFNPSGNLCIESGASVRVAEEKASGLRYQAYVDTAWYNGLENAQAGAIIVPNSYVEQVTKNGDFTLNGLMEFVTTDDLPFSAVDTAALATHNETYSTYALTLTGIQDANYVRNFVGIAYVRTSSTVEGAETISGYTGLENGNYVVAYDASNVRSVYQVAYNALTSGDSFDEETEAVLKSYADGVAVLSNAGGAVQVANNADGYTSPYSVVANGNSYVVESATANAKSVLYNDERQATLPIVDGDTTIHFTKTNGATKNGANGFSLAGTTIASGNPGSIYPVNASYYALNGIYEQGTYVEIEFTGNNMPSLLFFANEINGNMTYYENSETKEVLYDGLMVMNGLVADSVESPGKTFTDRVKAYGPHRYDYGEVSPIIVDKSGTDDGGMSMDDLSATPDTEYRLVAGTYVKPTSDGTSTRVWVDMYLINKSNNSIVGHLEVSTGKTAETFATDGTPKGYIVMYAPFKGGDDTTFKFNGVGSLSDFDVSGSLKIDGMFVKGATKNSAGSVTLDGVKVNNANTGNVKLVENSYVAWQGDYGVDTYVEFEFTGNNMPQLCFFANDINGWITGAVNGGSDYTVNEGMMIINGVVGSVDSTNCFTNVLKAYGKNRYHLNNVVIQKPVNASATNDADKAGNFLSQDALSTTYASTTFRMVIGTTLNAEGTRVFLVIRLFDKATGTRLAAIDISTGKEPSYFSADGTPSGHIIAMAGLKGGESTTFKVTKGPGARSEFDMVGGANA